MTIPANLRPGAFAGAAEAYATFRPPYPPALLSDLLARAHVGRDALLDLATGPGRIALDLAPHFEEVVALDLEPDMIAVGIREAARRGIGNVEWRIGRAEDFDAPPASFDLITIGEAFHRLEPHLVAQQAMGWLRPGGCLATLGTDNRFSGDEPWEVALREVRDRWLPRAFPDGWGTVLPGGALDRADRWAVFGAAGFVDIEEHELEERRTLRFEQIAGYLASTSVCSRTALVGSFEAWEADLRAALDDDGDARFDETIRWGYTLARKPS
jgi:protein-L-isoaspartate O-methyltransferase